MCGGSSVNPATAALQLFLQNREKEVICFSCQKQVEPVFGGRVLLVNTVISLRTEGDKCLCTQAALGCNCHDRMQEGGSFLGETRAWSSEDPGLLGVPASHLTPSPLTCCRTKAVRFAAPSVAAIK